jgi:hypothetical protein
MAESALHDHRDHSLLGHIPTLRILVADDLLSIFSAFPACKSSKLCPETPSTIIMYPSFVQKGFTTQASPILRRACSLSRVFVLCLGLDMGGFQDVKEWWTEDRSMAFGSGQMGSVSRTPRICGRVHVLIELDKSIVLRISLIVLIIVIATEVSTLPARVYIVC